MRRPRETSHDMQREWMKIYDEIPSSTPVTIDAKLSSSSIISAACLDTSDPVIPIATPSNHLIN